MNIALWIMQGLLALMFSFAGYGKLTNTVEQHVADGHLKEGESVMKLRVLGVLELLGVVGIIVPFLAGILPIFTPISAVCFALLMIGAFVVHLKRKEYKFLILPFVVFELSLIVAYFRFQELIK